MHFSRSPSLCLLCCFDPVFFFSRQAPSRDGGDAPAAQCTRRPACAHDIRASPTCGFTYSLATLYLFFLFCLRRATRRATQCCSTQRCAARRQTVRWIAIVLTAHCTNGRCIWRALRRCFMEIAVALRERERDRQNAGDMPATVITDVMAHLCSYGTQRTITKCEMSRHQMLDYNVRALNHKI